ncbi:MAG: hypothetical protein JXA42_15550, partial [Anaerolineales bacterium]|nr:hypothetical protein [Anaerolineales bacterium]
NTPIEIRIGPPDVGATPQSYAETITTKDGEFALSFSMPAEWPDGSPILIEEMVIVAINNDASVKSTVPFRYQADPFTSAFALAGETDDILTSSPPTTQVMKLAPKVTPVQTQSADNLELFQDDLLQALAERRFDRLQQLMGNPFSIAVWQSEGISVTPEEAIEQLKTIYPTGQAQTFLPTITDLPELPGGLDPWSLFGQDAPIAGILIVRNWGTSGTDEVMLYTAQRKDGSFYWFGLLFAPGGFSIP